MDPYQRLLAILADGSFHSGAALATQLGVSRTSIWKYVQRLGELGVEIHPVSGRGYRLASPLELLTLERVRSAMTAESLARLGQCELLFEVDSTNRRLLQQAALGAPSGYACLAEHQSAGRGRRGRDWVSPFGANIYLSVLWRFASGPAALGGLSLAVAVGAARALQEQGIDDVALKWPNDLLWGGRKLGGILLEVAGEAAGPCHVVVGIGLNVRMGNAGSVIDQPWVDAETAQGGAVSRNVLAGRLLHHLLLVLGDYGQHGLAPWREEWMRLDAYRGRRVRLVFADTAAVEGIAAGIDETGALVLDCEGERRRFFSGEVSLRAAE